MTTLHWVIISLLVPALALVTAGHALLHKKDPRAALGWVAFCLFFPLAGPIAYTLFGINRVFTRARKLEERNQFRLSGDRDEGQDDPATRLASPITAALDEPDSPAEEIFRVSEQVCRRPLLAGNQVTLMSGGEEVYPAMLRAIAAARQRVYLATYIFDTDKTGRTIIEALAAARGRGVDVRVLLDGVGELYSWPRASKLLRRAGVRVERFLPPRLLPPALHLNLRNHRKILVVDSEIGFAGGMNLGDRHLIANLNNRRRVNDIHFRLTGPVATQLEEIFLEDWGFCTGLPESPLHIMVGSAGTARCRAVVDGPNEDLGKLQFILLGAIAGARHSIDIMTPYFLPDREMISALQVAALRGVKISLVLPALNNLPYVHWATRHMLWELLKHGVRVYYQPPPFAHSKLFVVDSGYALIGSANFDPRSMRLNFEIGVEIAAPEFCRKLADLITETSAHSTSLTMAELDGRSLPVRLRDAAVWLFSPYL